MITSLITKTMDLIALSAAEREKVAHYREQIADEVIVNDELLDRLIRRYGKKRVTIENQDDVLRIFGGLKDGAFQRVSAGDLSLKRIFPEKLNRIPIRLIPESNGTMQYYVWTFNDKTVSDLLRRFYRNLDTHRSNVFLEPYKIDIGYLSFMLDLLRRSIKKNH